MYEIRNNQRSCIKLGVGGGGEEGAKSKRDRNSFLGLFFNVRHM